MKGRSILKSPLGILLPVLMFGYASLLRAENAAEVLEPFYTSFLGFNRHIKLSRVEDEVRANPVQARAIVRALVETGNFDDARELIKSFLGSVEASKLQPDVPLNAQALHYARQGVLDVIRAKTADFGAIDMSNEEQRRLIGLLFGGQALSTKGPQKPAAWSAETWKDFLKNYELDRAYESAQIKAILSALSEPENSHTKLAGFAALQSRFVKRESQRANQFPARPELGLSAPERRASPAEVAAARVVPMPAQPVRKTGAAQREVPATAVAVDLAMPDDSMVRAAGRPTPNAEKRALEAPESDKALLLSHLGNLYASLGDIQEKERAAQEEEAYLGLGALDPNVPKPHYDALARHQEAGDAFKSAVEYVEKGGRPSADRSNPIANFEAAVERALHAAERAREQLRRGALEEDSSTPEALFPAQFYFDDELAQPVRFAKLRTEPTEVAPEEPLDADGAVSPTSHMQRVHAVQTVAPTWDAAGESEAERMSERRLFGATQERKFDSQFIDSQKEEEGLPLREAQAPAAPVVKPASQASELFRQFEQIKKRAAALVKPVADADRSAQLLQKDALMFLRASKPALVALCDDRYTLAHKAFFDLRDLNLQLQDLQELKDRYKVTTEVGINDIKQGVAACDESLKVIEASLASLASDDKELYLKACIALAKYAELVTQAERWQERVFEAEQIAQEMQGKTVAAAAGMMQESATKIFGLVQTIKAVYAQLAAAVQAYDNENSEEVKESLARVYQALERATAARVLQALARAEMLYNLSKERIENQRVRDRVAVAYNEKFERARKNLAATQGLDDAMKNVMQDEGAIRDLLANAVRLLTEPGAMQVMAEVHEALGALRSDALQVSRAVQQAVELINAVGRLKQADIAFLEARSRSLDTKIAILNALSSQNKEQDAQEFAEAEQREKEKARELEAAKYEERRARSGLEVLMNSVERVSRVKADLDYRLDILRRRLARKRDEGVEESKDILLQDLSRRTSYEARAMQEDYERFRVILAKLEELEQSIPFLEELLVEYRTGLEQVVSPINSTELVDESGEGEPEVLAAQFKLAEIRRRREALALLLKKMETSRHVATWVHEKQLEQKAIEAYLGALVSGAASTKIALPTELWAKLILSQRAAAEAFQAYKKALDSFAARGTKFADFERVLETLSVRVAQAGEEFARQLQEARKRLLEDEKARALRENPLVDVFPTSPTGTRMRSRSASVVGG